MLNQSALPATSQLHLHIAGADVAIFGPRCVLEIVDCMLAHVSHDWVEAEPPLRIDVAYDADAWRVRGESPSGHKTLGRLSALPQVAGATISSLLAELAYHRNFNVWRAAVVERDDRALAMIGADWESCVTLTAHLHTRGWRILGGDYALVSGDTMVVSVFKKVLHANSSCVAAFPHWYRRAIEASPWYSTSQAIAFYAIDPTLVEGTPPWAEQAPLCAVLRVDGNFADHPALEAIDEFPFASGFRRHQLSGAGVQIGSLVIGDFVETCDLIEAWFACLPAAALARDLVSS